MHYEHVFTVGKDDFGSNIVYFWTKTQLLALIYINFFEKGPLIAIVILIFAGLILHKGLIIKYVRGSVWGGGAGNNKKMGNLRRVGGITKWPKRGGGHYKFRRKRRQRGRGPRNKIIFQKIYSPPSHTLWPVPNYFNVERIMPIIFVYDFDGAKYISSVFDH